MLDFADTTVAKSDQLNADDLIMGPVVVQITKITEGKAGSDQPFDVHITGGFKPWRPCKTMRRLLVACWGKSGPNGENYVGRWVKLYRDPEAKWAGEAVGGVRVSHLSHLDEPKSVALNESKAGSSKKSKKMWHVEPLTPPNGGTKQDRAATLSRWCNLAVKEGGWTVDQVKALLGNRPAKDIPDEEHEKLIAALKGQPPSDPEAEAFDSEVPPEDGEDYGASGEES